MKDTLHSQFLSNVEAFPDRVLLHHVGRDWSYAEIAGKAQGFASRLNSAGVSRGDRVVLLVANSAEYLVSYFGVLLAGGIVVALNPETTSRELAYTVDHCAPTAMVCNRRAVDQVDEAKTSLRTLRAIFVVQDSPDKLTHHDAVPLHPLDLDSLESQSPQSAPGDAAEIAQIIYTSGTTGRPKGVTLSHGNLLANTQSICSYLRLTEEDSVFVILPFYYSYGNSLLLTHVAVGGRLILASDFVFWNRALETIVGQRATGFSGVPSTFAMLLHRSKFAKTQFPDLRYLTCAGGALAPATVKRIQEHLPSVELFLMYGQTEASARLSTLLPEEVEAKLGSIGRGIPGVDLRVLDQNQEPVRAGEQGEIYAKGENIMAGYWNDSSATKEAITPHGLRTGDLATVDEDGYIYVSGRRSDMIKSGAFRVNPLEIEEIILEHAQVAEVAVVGQPDEILGERIVAYTVVSDPAPTEEQLLAHCNGILPGYKSVKEVHIVADLPKTSSGKIRRSELKREPDKSNDQP